MKCLNCSRQLNCGCKKRTTTDGKSACTLCVEEYEKRLKSKKEQENSSNSKT